MENKTKHLIMKELVSQSAQRTINMKSAIALGIIDFRSYQDCIERKVERDVKIINHLSEKRT